MSCGVIDPHDYMDPSFFYTTNHNLPHDQVAVKIVDFVVNQWGSNENL